MDKRAFLLRRKPVNEEEVSEPFAREQRKVNGGHEVPEGMNLSSVANNNLNSNMYENRFLNLSGHYSGDWSEYVNVIGAIREPFAREFR